MFTVGIIVAGGLFVVFVRRDPFSGWWRGGKKDAFRLLFFREDGTLRRYTKRCLVVYWTIFIAVVWML